MLKLKLNVTTNAGGAGDVTVPLPGGPLTGLLLHAVEWIDGTFDNGVDAVLSCVNTLSAVDRTLLTLTNADNDAIYYPRVLESDTVGAALLTSYTPLIVDGSLKLAVTAGGNAKTDGCVCFLLET